MNTKPLGLYLHIPFCRRKCAYCDFYSLPRGAEAMDAYTDALCAALRAAAPRAAGYCADTVYFGGGTPSLLGEARLSRLLETAAASFALAPDAEITFEANPESACDVSVLRALRRAGFNRVSLGMQSADDGMLTVLGRIHTHGDTRRAVGAARQAGFENLSLDLMYGLPGQDAALWRGTLSAALALQPEHLSCYALKLEPGTPLYARHDPLPDDDAQVDMYLDAVSQLAAGGYAQYEISNFARPGFASRHNLKYWTLGEYLGFGPGAHSDFGGRRFALARDLDAFLRGETVFSEDAPIPAQERSRERVLLGLRTSRGLPADLLAPAAPLLRELIAHGLADGNGGRFALTPQGFLVSNEIIIRILDALGL